MPKRTDVSFENGRKGASSLSWGKELGKGKQITIYAPEMFEDLWRCKNGVSPLKSLINEVLLLVKIHGMGVLHPTQLAKHVLANPSAKFNDDLFQVGDKVGGFLCTRVSKGTMTGSGVQPQNIPKITFDDI